MYQGRYKQNSTDCRIGFALLLQAVVSGLCCFCGIAAAQEAALRLPPPVEELYERYIHNRLEVGARISWYSFTEAERYEYNEHGEFEQGLLGSIVRIDEERSFAPTFFLRTRLNTWVDVELGWERIEGATVKYEGETSDGDLFASGPSLLIRGRYPSRSRFTPFAGIGLVLLNADFEHWGPWHYGFNASNMYYYETWIREGRNPRVNGGYRRNIEVEDAVGSIITLGSAYRLGNRLEAELSWRYMDVNIDSSYFLSWHGTHRRVDRGNFALPLDNWALQMGIKYCF